MNSEANVVDFHYWHRDLAKNDRGLAGVRAGLGIALSDESMFIIPELIPLGSREQKLFRLNITATWL